MTQRIFIVLENSLYCTTKLVHGEDARQLAPARQFARFGKFLTPERAPRSFQGECYNMQRADTGYQWSRYKLRGVSAGNATTR